MEFVALPPPAGAPDRAFRSLAGNTAMFVRLARRRQPTGRPPGALASATFRPSTGFVKVAPLGTALIAVLPSVFGPIPGDPTPIPNPVFEVRGLVQIKLPALFKFIPPFTISFFSTPQSENPSVSC